MYNELMNTSESGTGFLQNSSSGTTITLSFSGGSKFKISQTVFESSG